MPPRSLFDHSKRRFVGYLQRRIPDPLDEVVGRVVAEHRVAITSGSKTSSLYIGDSDAEVLGVYAQRMAVRAVRERSVEDVKLGLISLGMASSSSIDYRENLMVLALVARSAELLGVDFGSLVDETAQCLPSQALEGFRAFARRSVEDRKIRNMGFAESGSGNDFNYVRASPWS